MVALSLCNLRVLHCWVVVKNVGNERDRRTGGERGERGERGEWEVREFKSSRDSGAPNLELYIEVSHNAVHILSSGTRWMLLQLFLVGQYCYTTRWRHNIIHYISPPISSPQTKVWEICQQQQQQLGYYLLCVSKFFIFRCCCCVVFVCFIQ